MTVPFLHLLDLKINESRRTIYCHLVDVSFWIQHLPPLSVCVCERESVVVNVCSTHNARLHLKVNQSISETNLTHSRFMLLICIVFTQKNCFVTCCCDRNRCYHCWTYARYFAVDCDDNPSSNASTGVWLWQMYLWHLCHSLSLAFPLLPYFLRNSPGLEWLFKGQGNLLKRAELFSLANFSIGARQKQRQI